MTTLCDRCGAFGDMPHGWIEGDCVLPHKTHHKATIGHCCAGCIDRHKTWLTEITELYATLSDVIPLGSIPDDAPEHTGKPRKRPASPAPFRLAAWAMLADRKRLFRTYKPSDLPDVPAVLTDLAGRLLEDNDQAGTSLDGTVTAAVRILTEWADRMARSAWIDEYDDELRWMRKQLRLAHGINDPKPVGRCPSLDGDGQQCKGPLWPDRYGAMAVDCGKCKRHFDEAFLRHLGGMLTAGHAEA